MNKLLILFVLFFFWSTQYGFAQKQKISGNVSDNYGPLPQTSVLIKGTTIGTTTDFDGNYSIQVTTGDIIVFSFMGYTTKEKKVTIDSPTTINIVLEEGNSLKEVVITAQGIKKEKKALGYAITNLNKEELENKPEADVSRALQGKIAGVQISSASGSSGEPTSITIRSSLSIDGNNSPLIVVNNVPFAGTLLDIDPNNIKTLSVLKGLNASVLYGSEGRNGVILIQTKSGSSEIGKKRFSTTISQTTYMNVISGLPEYQNKYGQGSDFNFVAGNVGTWGPAFSSLDYVPHPYSGNPEFPEYDGVMVPYQAANNNVKNFFRNGIGSTTSLNINSAQESTAFNLSTGYTNEEGIIGNNDLKRFNLGVGGSAQLNNKLKINATLNYSTRKRNSYDESTLFRLLLYIPRSMDVYNLPFQDSQGRNAYYRGNLNPKWLMNNSNKLDDITRVFGTFSGVFTYNNHVDLTYRIGYDNQNYHEFDYSNKGGVGGDFEFGFLNIGNNKRLVFDQTVMANLNYNLSDNFALDAQIGVNSKLTQFKSSKSLNDNQIVYAFLRPNNYATQSNDYYEEKINLAGAFAQLGFSYKNYLYLNLSGRNDWGSTVEPKYRSLFYPGVSISFIPTSSFSIKSDMLNYLKLRGAYATSSGYPSPYNTRSTLNTNPIRFISPEYSNIISNSSSRILANPNLRPELHKEIEIGIESKLFKNKVTLDASVFKRISKDQILGAELPPEVGFDKTTINVGRIDTRGVEIDLGIDLLKRDHFSWNFRNLFSAYESIVVDLPTGDLEFGGNRWAIEGEPLGVIVGDYVLRDQEGNYLINPNTGRIIISDDAGLEDRIIANPTPDWTLTNINTFQYKNFILSAQLEYTHGGKSYSDLADDLLRRGVTRDTENREGSFIIPGVYGDTTTGLPFLDANGNTIPNTVQISAQDVSFNHFYNADDLATFDTSVFRIREIAIEYDINKKQFSSFPFESLGIRFSGRNVFYKAPGFPKYTNIDPELDTSDNRTRTPTTSRYSLSLTFKF